MTDRLSGFIVTLESDIREDDAEKIVSAIGCLRGVLSVKPIVADYESAMAEERARRDLGDRLLDVVYPDRKARG